MIRLLLVDDQPSVRQGLRMRLTLEPDITIVGEAHSGAEALRLAQQLRPDVVLMDIEMPEMDGLQAAAALRHQSDLGTAVVVISIHDTAMMRTKARDAGAAAFVAKQEKDHVLPAAIRQAAARLQRTVSGA